MLVLKTEWWWFVPIERLFLQQVHKFISITSVCKVSYWKMRWLYVFLIKSILNKVTNICPKCVALVHNNQRCILWNHCLYWYHAKCCCINKGQYTSLSNCSETWLCLRCLCDAFPYYGLNNVEFNAVVNDFESIDIDSKFNKWRFKPFEINLNLIDDSNIMPIKTSHCAIIIYLNI